MKQGTIIKSISNQYTVKVNETEYIAIPRGKFKKQEIQPVVGDKVKISIEDEFIKKAVIEEIQPRKIFIKRPKIANITQLVLVISGAEPKPDLLLLDKQLAFAEYYNLKSIIIFNKIDLDKKSQFDEIKKTYLKVGYPVIATQAKQEIGIEELQQLLYGNINAFAGNSGVGKSTLINSLFKTDMTKEGQISYKNKRGKNTTTVVQLYQINSDTYIADTPGFSTFDISEIESNKLTYYFKEFVENVSGCQFSGCTHIKEETCGIKEAIKKGKISKQRYVRFCKIYEELKEKEKNKW